jgi:hypothetical protein
VGITPAERHEVKGSIPCTESCREPCEKAPSKEAPSGRWRTKTRREMSPKQVLFLESAQNTQAKSIKGFHWGVLRGERRELIAGTSLFIWLYFLTQRVFTAVGENIGKVY